ncbi:hypothetical protein C265_12526 [Cupriavidus sp. GA3-3]|nr:hypothetical protein C265_12526 [Cupriavidus sp. GA3-3]
MVNIHTPQMAQTSLSIRPSVANVDLADVARQYVRLLIFRSILQVFVIETVFIGQCICKLILDSVAVWRKCKKTSLAHQSSVLILAGLPQANTSLVLMLCDIRLVEHI